MKSTNKRECVVLRAVDADPVASKFWISHSPRLQQDGGDPAVTFTVYAGHQADSPASLAWMACLRATTAACSTENFTVAHAVGTALQ